MIERAMSLVIGTLLVGGVFVILSRPSRSARVIQDYYAGQVARETARGWLGKPLLVPGKRASLTIVLLLAAVMLSIGVYSFYVGLMA